MRTFLQESCTVKSECFETLNRVETQLPPLSV